MEYKPRVQSLLHIGDTDYNFCEHPAHYGQLYSIKGQKSIVYQLKSEAGSLRAFKIFPPENRRQRYAEIGELLQPLGNIPGLQVCRRTVITPLNNSMLLSTYENLQFDILMPWVNGETWQEVQFYQRKISPEQCQEIAKSLAHLLARMEEKNMAHCELCAPNILLPGMQPAADKYVQTGSEQSLVALVDLEDVYLPGLSKPEVLPRGMRGYAHKESSLGSWAPEADRFAGAIIICEMLSWFNDGLRQLSFGESYFDPTEIHSSGSERYRALLQVIETQYGRGVSTLLESAWCSSSLKSCPPFAEWARSLRSFGSEAVVISDVRSRLKPVGSPILPPDNAHYESQSPGDLLYPSQGESISPYFEALTAVEKSKTWTRLDNLDMAIKELEDSYRLDAEVIGNPLAENLILRANRNEKSNNLEAALSDYERAMAQATSPSLKNRIASLIMETRLKSELKSELERASHTSAVMTCPQCHSPIQENTQLCPICGHDFIHPDLNANRKSLLFDIPSPLPALHLLSATLPFHKPKNLLNTILIILIILAGSVLLLLILILIFVHR